VTIDADAAVRLLDDAAVANVAALVARAVDRLDWEQFRSCYRPDAFEDHGGYKGSITGLIDWLRPLLAKFDSTTHLIGNQLVEVEGDVAWAESYCIALHRFKPVHDKPLRDWLVNVRYCDRLELTNGEWRIAHRVCVFDSERRDAVATEGQSARSVGRL
jgi:hypothetical protein